MKEDMEALFYLILSMYNEESLPYDKISAYYHNNNSITKEFQVKEKR